MPRTGTALQAEPVALQVPPAPVRAMAVRLVGVLAAAVAVTGTELLGRELPGPGGS